MTKPAFTTLDSTALTAVHGGRRASSSRASTDDQLLDKLDSIESSLKDVGKAPTSNGMSEVLPLVALSMMNQPQPQQAPPVVVVRRGRC